MKNKKHTQRSRLILPAGNDSIIIMLDLTPQEVEANFIHFNSRVHRFPACNPEAGDSLTCSIERFAHGQVWGIKINWNTSGPREIEWVARDHLA